MHACQLERQDKDLKETTFYFQYICLKQKKRHDIKHNIYKEKLAIGSIVILYNL